MEKNNNNYNEPGLIYKKITDIMLDIEAISKDQKNLQQGFKFRGVDDIYNEMHPLMAKHKVFNTTEIIGRAYKERQTKSGGVMIERILTVRFKFFAEDGSWVDSTIDGESIDTGDKSTSKCLSIAHKYALLQIFCIPTVDNERDGPKDPDYISHDLDPDGEKNNSNHKKPIPPKTNPANSPVKPVGAPTESKPTFQKEWKLIHELRNKLKMDMQSLTQFMKENVKKELAHYNVEDFNSIAHLLTELFYKTAKIEKPVADSFDNFNEGGI